MNKINKEKLDNISEPCRIFARNNGIELVLRFLVEADDKSLLDDISIQIKTFAKQIIKKIF